MKLPEKREVFYYERQKIKIKFDSFECNLLINGIFEWRNQLLEQDLPIEDVDALLLKIINEAEAQTKWKD